MIKFTTEEISLCKQVAKRHRKKLCHGDWWHRNRGNYPAEIVIVQGEGSADVFNDINEHARLHSYGFPLWTISDCLEFFNERAFYLEGLCQIDECEYECCVSELDDLGIVRGTKRRFEGKATLEACLKAVLAVLEEGK